MAHITIKIIIVQTHLVLVIIVFVAFSISFSSIYCSIYIDDVLDIDNCSISINNMYYQGVLKQINFNIIHIN